MTDTIRIGDQWYVAAKSARTEEHPQVLKHDETFAMFDRFGDIPLVGSGEQGLYHEDTRFLSRQELQIEGARPLYLGSTVQEYSSLLTIDLMNPDFECRGARVPKGSLHIFRAKLLWQGACYEHIRVGNHAEATIEATLGLTWDADFVDVFEVRGMERGQRGERLPAEVGPARVLLPYRGLDGRTRRTRLLFEPAPTRCEAQHASFALRLAPGEERHLYFTAVCETADDAPPLPVADYPTALARSGTERKTARAQQCLIETSNPLVNLWLERSASDIEMLTTTLPTGPYPYAGVPWYSTTFGRDGIITAREMLWADPTLARGVLAFLADTQADSEDPERDAEPGKILHEARRSEMAVTREIPFGRYYGTVDATPLFVALAGAYHRRTGDSAFIRSIWPHIVAALHWIDRYGDADGDGFVEYERRSSEGLANQGWKDSHDSVFHADGRIAEPPIALVEVQGYVYEAKTQAAEMARHLGEHALAVRLDDEAQALKQKFDEAFWCAAIGSYAIALDGRKRQCAVLTSNPGHALWTGVAAPEHAERVARGLLDEAMYNGWGIRTVGTGQPRYNPMSYHDGSVWPHDNAIAAAGMTRYGRTAEAMRVFAGLFESSLYFDQHRLPELFCGFPRRAAEGPTLYPVACSPQAWAAAAPFAMLQACLGLDIDAARAEVSLRTPRLPDFIQWVRVRHLAVGAHGLDLLLQRYENNGVGVEVMKKDGPVGIVVTV